MRTADLQYTLPDELVASRPTARREEARLMVLTAGGIGHRRVADWPALLPEDALVVLNNTRVLAARLHGTKAGTGGRVEVLLVRRLAATRDASGAVAERWTAMAKANRKLKRGSELHLGRSLRAFVEQPADDEGIVQLILGRRLDGSATASPGLVDGDETLAAAIEAEGGMPLPPYIDRPAEPSDRERYQTVFARVPGAVAAPTAGLHLSRALLDRLHRRARVAELTLHVGPGTFRPVTAESLDQHAMHAETYDIPAATAEAIAEARERGAPVVAVGTTVVRALEAAAADDASGQVRAGAAETQLLIQPGYRFRVVDALLTNFHLPRSTLLALVYAFAGAERVAEAYRTAIAERYRFYSYGDAMFLPRATPGDSTAGPR